MKKLRLNEIQLRRLVRNLINENLAGSYNEKRALLGVILTEPETGNLDMKDYSFKKSVEAFLDDAEDAARKAAVDDLEVSPGQIKSSMLGMQREQLATLVDAFPSGSNLRGRVVHAAAIAFPMPWGVYGSDQKQGERLAQRAVESLARALEPGFRALAQDLTDTYANHGEDVPLTMHIILEDAHRINEYDYVSARTSISTGGMQESRRRRYGRRFM